MMMKRKEGKIMEEMNFESFKNMYLNNLKNADEAVSTADEFLKSVEEVFDYNDAYKNKIQELEDKNNELRDMNTKLSNKNVELLLRESSFVDSRSNDEIEAEERHKRVENYKQIAKGGLF